MALKFSQPHPFIGDCARPSSSNACQLLQFMAADFDLLHACLCVTLQGLITEHDISHSYQCFSGCNWSQRPVSWGILCCFLLEIFENLPVHVHCVQWSEIILCEMLVLLALSAWHARYISISVF